MYPRILNALLTEKICRMKITLIQAFPKCIPSIFHGTPTSATIMIEVPLIRMSNFDDKYLEIIKRVCDSLPESFCRGAIIDISNVERKQYFV